ncbi:MAG: hypothetical protein K2F79_08525, partial [Muribaculaceae bacterium]|nr:hypothetical protein [Muribaculaceae bacterium]
MKQLLLTLAAAAMSICASAATVVIPASSLTTVPGETTISGFTVDVQKNNGQTAPQVYQGKALRTYAKNTVTISGKNIYKVVFEIAESGVYRYTTF